MLRFVYILRSSHRVKYYKVRSYGLHDSRRIDTEKLNHKEYPFFSNTKVYFSLIAFYVTILDIGLEIAKLMEEMIKKGMEVST